MLIFAINISIFQHKQPFYFFTFLLLNIVSVTFHPL